MLQKQTPITGASFFFNQNGMTWIIGIEIAKT